MKSPEELKPLLDDLLYSLRDANGHTPFLSGMVTILSLVLEVPDECGMEGCTENHDAMRDRFIADLRAKVAKARKMRKIQGAHNSARQN